MFTPTEKLMIDNANAQMTQLCATLLNTGRAKTVGEATQIACREQGASMAKSLEYSLRMMGANDITVTCP